MTAFDTVGRPVLNDYLYSPHLSDGSPHSLSLDSTLQDLLLHDFWVEADQPGQKVLEAFEEFPLLPGVIITDKGEFVGMISRRRFLEQLIRPYGMELFLKRSLRSLFRFTHTKATIFSAETLIVAAAHQSLQRKAELVYEPLVVELAPKVYRLLDAHQLLVAQSQIHELATALLTQLYHQLEVANQQLHNLATSDGLTKVANRRRFDEYLDTCWQNLRGASPLSLIMCDVDFFKSYNDRYGHQAGDDCLQQVAQVLQQSVKRPEDLVARYGGEEFALILPYTPVAGAMGVAKKIQEGMRQLNITHDDSPITYVTLSMGVSNSFMCCGESPSVLIAAADAALYQAKQAGRDRVLLQMPVNPLQLLSP